MAEEGTDPALLESVRNLNRQRSSTWGRLALGGMGMETDINRGMSVAEAVKRHFPMPQAQDGNYEETKAGLITALAKLQEGDENERVAKMKLAMGGGNRDRIMELTLETFNNMTNAGQKASEARIKALNDAQTERNSVTEAQLAENYGKLSATMPNIGDLASSIAPLGIGDVTSVSFQELANAVAKAPDNNTRYQLLKQVASAISFRHDGLTLYKLIQDAHENGDDSAQDLYKFITEEVPPIRDKTELTMEAQQQQQIDIIDIIKRTGGGGDPQKIKELFTIISALYAKGEDPSEAMDKFREELTGQPPGTDPTEALEALLKEFERPDLPQSLRDARRALFASPMFQEYMETNGFAAGQEKFALRGLRTEVRDKRLSGNIKGRENLERMERGLPPPGDSARLAGEGPGTDAQKHLTLANVAKQQGDFEVAYGPKPDGEGSVVVIRDPSTGEVRSYDYPGENDELLDELVFEEDRKKNMTLFSRLSEEFLETLPQQSIKTPSTGGKVKPPSLSDIRTGATNILRQSQRPLGETARKVGQGVKSQVEKMGEQRAAKKTEKALARVQAFGDPSAPETGLPLPGSPLFEEAKKKAKKKLKKTLGG